MVAPELFSESIFTSIKLGIEKGRNLSHRALFWFGLIVLNFKEYFLRIYLYV